MSLAEPSSSPSPAPEPKAGKRSVEALGELPSTLEADADAVRRYEQEVGAAKLLCRAVPISRKIVLTALLLGLLVALPYAHPILRPLRLLSRTEAAEDAVPAGLGAPLPTASVGEVQVPGGTEDGQGRGRELDAPIADNRGPIAHQSKPDPALVGSASAGQPPPRPIDDPSGQALDHFMAKLRQVERKEPGAIARIVYYGDSIVASDFVTGKLRRLLQDRFGDAGHGYSLIANAWPGWFHIDVSRKASAEWAVSTCVGPYAEDGIYGLGCASFVAHHAGVWARFATADADAWGRSVSRFELEYLAQPGGGAVELLVDGEPHGRLETAADTVELRWHELAVPDGPHALELRSADDRPVRLFGVRMERDVPGVSLTAMGVTGARARFLDKQDDAAWAAALRAAKPDLVVLAFGTNEITDGSKYSMEDYEKTLVAVMAQVRAAVPEASVMLAGPPDMASNNAGQGHSKPYGFIIARKQKEIAAAQGWAFWDQFNAMGGGGSMWSWIQMGLGSQDMIHPTGQGGSVLGRFEYAALMQAYDRYCAEHP